MVVQLTADRQTVKLAAVLASKGEVGAAARLVSAHLGQPDEVRNLKLHAQFKKVGAKERAGVAHGHAESACNLAAQCFEAPKGVAVAHFDGGLQSVNA